MRSFTAAPQPVNPLINQGVSDTIGEHARRFADARPFRHVVIDDFFEARTAQALLREFPAFDPKFARNEAGGIGNKAVIEKIRALGPAYVALDDLIQTPAFLAMIGRITGIEKLRYDPWYYGGGTHENREGQDLDPHIDFNRHPVDRSHRRLNLIVYLNPEWDDAWGGSLEIHRDPRAPDNHVKLITPLFNRCVIFETNEISWHGFSRIALPPERKHLSRRSIALYFYTAERPTEELADTHSTVYVDRPLPSRIVPGHVLEHDDLVQLELLLARRDQHNQRLYAEITRLTGELETARAVMSRGFIGRLAFLARRAIQHLRA